MFVPVAIRPGRHIIIGMVVGDLKPKNGLNCSGNIKYMSVAKIIDAYPPSMGLPLLAWKAFRKSESSPKSIFFPHWDINGKYNPGTDKVLLNTWLRATNQDALTLEGTKYISGFHTFRSMEYAKKWVNGKSNRVIIPVTINLVRYKMLHCPEYKHKDIPSLEGWVSDLMYIDEAEIQNYL